MQEFNVTRESVDAKEAFKKASGKGVEAGKSVPKESKAKAVPAKIALPLNDKGKSGPGNSGAKTPEIKPKAGNNTSLSTNVSTQRIGKTPEVAKEKSVPRKTGKDVKDSQVSLSGGAVKGKVPATPVKVEAKGTRAVTPQSSKVTTGKKGEVENNRKSVPFDSKRPFKSPILKKGFDLDESNVQDDFTTRLQDVCSEGGVEASWLEKEGKALAKKPGDATLKIELQFRLLELLAAKLVKEKKDRMAAERYAEELGEKYSQKMVSGDNKAKKTGK